MPLYLPLILDALSYVCPLQSAILMLFSSKNILSVLAKFSPVCLYNEINFIKHSTGHLL